MSLVDGFPWLLPSTAEHRGGGGGGSQWFFITGKYYSRWSICKVRVWICLMQHINLITKVSDIVVLFLLSFLSQLLWYRWLLSLSLTLALSSLSSPCISFLLSFIFLSFHGFQQSLSLAAHFLCNHFRNSGNNTQNKRKRLCTFADFVTRWRNKEK